MKRSLLPFVFSLLLGLTALSAAPEIHAYQTVSGRELKLWLEKPAEWKKTDRRPAVIFFHGGGWAKGEPKQFAEHCRHLARQGIVAASAEYRFWESDREPAPTLCIQDARAAVRWLTTHAEELGIDPEKIAVGGGSAGGHLAVFSALGSEFDPPSEANAPALKPGALILFNPALDLTVRNKPEDSVYPALRRVSPRFISPKGLPPTLIMVGDKDTTTPAAIALDYARLAREQGADVTVKLYPGQTHGFFNHNADGNPWYDRTIADMDQFLQRLGWLLLDTKHKTASDLSIKPGERGRSS